VSGNKRSGFVLQDRDRHLLRELEVMRVIDREQAKLVGGFGSTTRANARLLALRKAGLLRRYFQPTTAGGMRALYALSLSGAQLLGLQYRGPRRKQNEVLVADFFVAHQLAVNEIYCTLKYRPIPVPEARFVRWASFSKPIDSGRSLIPDGYVEILAGKPIAAFLEIDLGHEGQKVWKAKIETYLRYAVSGQFQREFREPRFRVLVITNSERRAESIRALAGSLTEKVFWFSTFSLINRDGFWSSVWVRPRDTQKQPLV
jgi:Replication-relaxation